MADTEPQLMIGKSDTLTDEESQAARAEFFISSSIQELASHYIDPILRQIGIRLGSQENTIDQPVVKDGILAFSLGCPINVDNPHVIQDGYLIERVPNTSADIIAVADGATLLATNQVSSSQDLVQNYLRLLRSELMSSKSELNTQLIKVIEIIDSEDYEEDRKFVLITKIFYHLIKKFNKEFRLWCAGASPEQFPSGTGAPKMDEFKNWGAIGYLSFSILYKDSLIAIEIGRSRDKGSIALAHDNKITDFSTIYNSEGNLMPSRKEQLRIVNMDKVPVRTLYYGLPPNEYNADDYGHSRHMVDGQRDILSMRLIGVKLPQDSLLMFTTDGVRLKEKTANDSTQVEGMGLKNDDVTLILKPT